jgi:1-aminocyclopropane-1-carboxylate deaminase
MLIDTKNITIDELKDELFIQKKVRVQVLRLDKIDPIISGNKIFKLHYFLDETTADIIITFGGAYSNHLAATAKACKDLNKKCIGIVRGEKPNQLSHTLQLCITLGMQLKFISREDYDCKETAEFLDDLKNEFTNPLIIPEGGYNTIGATGAALIMNLIKTKNYTHICTAVGTGTTLAGLLLGATPTQEIIGIPVLKNLDDIYERINDLTAAKQKFNNLTIWSQFHFGGYAKKTPELISFINSCWLQHTLPLDFVYTAKAFFGLLQKINEDYFAPNSNILFIHTGGLQGNLSLPANTLLF